jgi:uncharacterized radical SAM superfamily Fe-S cluster-containing enzyme
MIPLTLTPTAPSPASCCTPAAHPEPAEDRVLSVTESVCPHCLRRLPAERVARGDDVHLVKTCPDHGRFSTVIWRGAPPSFESWVRPKTPSLPTHPFTAVDRGCPFDCGLCPDHRQTSCCVLLEVTQRCDLRCPVCFADAGRPGRNRRSDPSIARVEGWYRRLLEAGGPVNVQLSGGEPTLRDDLPDIIGLGRQLGFTFFQLNTNGLRLGRDREYVHRLAEAGLSTVFLQFDGVRDDVHRALRGRGLVGHKHAAIEACAAEGLGVVLVPTLVPGVNDGDLGAIMGFALEHAPVVRGVHVQPVSYFGRYPHPPQDADRITVPEVMRAIERGTGGRIAVTSFAPPGGENALCSFHGNFVIMPDGALVPLTRNPAASGCCPAPVPAREGADTSRRTVARLWATPSETPSETPSATGSASGGPSLGGWDTLLNRARTHTFSVSGMAFQDVWNLDLERLRDCYIHDMSPDGRLIPFCAYNLTDAAGTPLYR